MTFLLFFLKKNVKIVEMELCFCWILCVLNQTIEQKKNKKNCTPIFYFGLKLRFFDFIEMLCKIQRIQKKEWNLQFIGWKEYNKKVRQRVEAHDLNSLFLFLKC